MKSIVTKRLPQSRRRSGATATTLQPKRQSRAAGAPRSRPDQPGVCEVECVDHQKVGLAREALPASANLGTLADLLRALGDRTRLQILCALATDGVDELCVCDLATLVDVSSSAVSHSLRTLRQLDLVRYRRSGKIAYYALNDAHVWELVRNGLRHIEHNG